MYDQFIILTALCVLQTHNTIYLIDKQRQVGRRKKKFQRAKSLYLQKLRMKNFRQTDNADKLNLKDLR